MAFSDIYRQQVALLIRTLPAIAQEDCFALKGGTAINLFVRNMPRLSVDIDLTYLPVQPRQKSLNEIGAALKRIAKRIQDAIEGVRIHESVIPGERALTKLIVRANDVQIKIEVTPVLRGCVYQPELKTVSPAVESDFGFAEIKVVSFPDLYAGKCVAALDRQHPRDLFDVRDLIANEGIDDQLRAAFIVYILSHNRPMWEVLGSPQKALSEEFTRNFDGMTDKPVRLDELTKARANLVEILVKGMPNAHREMLMSFEKGNPDWSLLGIPGAQELPAILWRQQNLDSLSAEKRAELVTKLESVLGSSRK